ncbi:reverse transcriptase domain-containing protein [Tanacetum coccineum]
MSDHNPFQATSDERYDHNPFQVTSDESSDDTLKSSSEDTCSSEDNPSTNLPGTKNYGCGYFDWKDAFDERLMVSSSSTSEGPHRSVQPQPSYSSGPCRSEPIECSNCKVKDLTINRLESRNRALKARLRMLEARLEMERNPEDHALPSTPPSYSSGPSTPQIYSPGSSRNAECSNCKQLRGRISVLKATMEMHMHPEQHTLNSAALLHEVKLEDIEKLEEVPQVLKSYFEKWEEVPQVLKSYCVDQLPTMFKDTLKKYTNYEDFGKINGKKILMLSAKATILNFSDANLYIRIMPKAKTNRVKYPEGWELIEPTLRELQGKMREVGKDKGKSQENPNEPASDAVLREFCEKNYNQLLSILAEKMHQEKIQQEKLKAVKARLNFEEVSQYSESGAPSKRRDVRKRLGPKGVRNVSGSPEPKHNRSRSPRKEESRRETVFRRLEKGVFYRLGDKEKSMSAYSGSSRRQFTTTHNPEKKQKQIPRRFPAQLGNRSPLLIDITIKEHTRAREEECQKVRIVQEDTGSLNLRSKGQAAAKVERWAMPTWCLMFNSTLTGNARVCFDDLPPESIDSYDDLKEALLSNYLQQKKCIKDPVEIHHIKQREGESTEDFVRRFKIESRDVKGAPEVMRISGFITESQTPS